MTHRDRAAGLANGMMMSEDFRIEWESIDGVWVARLVGRLDLSRAMDLEAMMKAQLEETPAPLAVNLSRMSYLPSAGVGALLNIHRFSNERKLKVALCEVPPEVRRLLDVVELTSLLPVFDTQDLAVAALKTS